MTGTIQKTEKWWVGLDEAMFRGKCADKIKADATIQMLREDLGKRFVIVGGAVVDILEGRKPKDYDFRNLPSHDLLVSKGWLFISDSATAKTYRKDSITIQELKTSPADFEYVISQSRINLNGEDLCIDKMSFTEKLLIPISYKPDTAYKCMRRLPHWLNKGYSIQDLTYQSVLTALAGAKSRRNERDLQS